MNEQELTEEISGFDETTKQKLRLQAERDNYFFCKGILGMAEMNTQLHKPLCEVLNAEESLREMYLISRGHLKSSVITVGNNTRHALRDPEHRIMIGNEVYENSLAFVGQIKQYLESNTFIRLLWPDRIPTRTAGPGISWSASNLTLVRKGAYKEPTFFPIGMGGAVTSKHFTRITIDDLIGLEANRSPATMAAAIAWNSNVESLVVKASETVIQWVGTRWLGGDLYDDVIDHYEDDLMIFHRTCYNPDGTLTFPEMMTREFLERLERKDPMLFAAQYLNDPQSGFVKDFEYDRIRSFNVDPRGMIFWQEHGEMFSLDPMKDLDRVMSIDPNAGKKKLTTDFAAISVVGQGAKPEARIFSLESYADRPNPAELLDKAVEFYLRWRPRVVAVEEAGQQTTLFHLEERFKQEGFPAVIVASKPANEEKEQRIRNYLQPVIRDFRMFVPAGQVKLRKDLKGFPGVKKMDRLDSLAYTIPQLISPMSAQQEAQYRRATKALLRQRNPVTGYSDDPRRTV